MKNLSCLIIINFSLFFLTTIYSCGSKVKKNKTQLCNEFLAIATEGKNYQHYVLIQIQHCGNDKQLEELKKHLNDLQIKPAIIFSKETKSRKIFEHQGFETFILENNDCAKYGIISMDNLLFNRVNNDSVNIKALSF